MQLHKSISAFTLLLFSFLFSNYILAQTSPKKTTSSSVKAAAGGGFGGGSCSDMAYLYGPSSVGLGTTKYYGLSDQMNGPYTYSINCGTILSYNDNGVTVLFNSNCGASTIIAYNRCGLQVSSITVSLYPALIPGVISTGSQTISYEEVPSSLNANTATGGNCGGTYIYQWQYSSDGTLYRDIELENNQNLIFDQHITEKTFFRRMVICGVDTAYTASVFVDVNLPLNPGKILSANQSIDSNMIPLTIQASDATNCSDNVLYQWQNSIDGYSFKDILGAITRDLSFNAPLSQTSFFRRKANCNGNYSFTNTIVIALKSGSVLFHEPERNDLDSLITQSGVNLSTLFNLQSDSIANNRHPSVSPYNNLDTLSALDNLVAMLGQSASDSSDLVFADTALKIDDITNLLTSYSEGGVGSDTAQVFAPFMDDNLIQLYRSTGNFQGLDSIVNLETTISYEEANARLEETYYSSCPGCTLKPLVPSIFAKFKRSAVVDGSSLVVRDSTIRYYARFNFPLGNPSSIYWTVYGGLITSQNGDPQAGPIYVDVRWNSSFGAPYLAAFDRSSGQFGILPISFTLLQCRAFPTLQTLYFGAQPTALFATPCASASGTVNYQWQVLDVLSNTNWTDIAGATGVTYQPPPLTSTWLMYRRVSKVYNSSGVLIDTRVTSAVSVKLIPIDGGTITTPTETIPYNSSPSITATPALGGYTPPGSTLSYSWEVSVNNAAWMSIGNTENFAGYSVQYTNTRFRRTVQINGISTGNIPAQYWKAVSNELMLNTVYQTADYENRNYVRENIVLTRGITTWENADQLAIDKKHQSTTYLDALSRPIQNVSKGTHFDEQTGQWWDMVQSITYEAGGLISKSLLPYPSTENIGKFKNNAATDQPAYYSNNLNDANAFSKVEFDGSPLNNIKRAFAPGDSWVGSDVSVSGEIEPYSSLEKVRYLTIGYNATDLPQLKGIYPDLWLKKASSRDEKNKKVIVYTNKLGQVILKKVQLVDEASLSNQHSGWLCTYYVYDDLGNLRYVLTPKAVSELEANEWNFTQTIADELCFQYRYDDLRRICAKKVPGKVVEYYVYDKRDRIVFSQDGNGRAKSPAEWHTVLYDELNRPVISGLYHTTKTVSELQLDVDNAVSLSIYSANGGNFNLSLTPLTETAINNSSVFTELGFSYYDDYSYPGAQQFSTTELAYKQGDAEDHNNITKRFEGFKTGIKLKVLKEGVQQYLTTTVFYDDEGRLVQTKTENVAGGVDILASQYHFDGRKLSTIEIHSNPSTPYTNFPILTKYKFDKVGRIRAIAKKINNTNRDFATSTSINGALEDNDADYKIVSSYSYNELGRMTKKVLSPAFDNGQGIETLNYSYNVRGWLTGINKGYVMNEAGNDQWSHYFGLNIGYDNKGGWAASQLNGQITGIEWRSQGDNVRRKYEFEYDNANRLTKANFTQQDESAWSNAKMDFTVKNISYDDNGNLLSMTQVGVLPGAAPIAIDQLTYQYRQQTNLLTSVNDNAGTNDNGKLGDFKKDLAHSGDDYLYDENGNLIKDQNKNIIISYNYLDKPEKIDIVRTVAGGSTVVNTIKYVYVGGFKSQKIVIDNSAVPSGGQAKTTTTTYIGAFVYEQVTTGTLPGPTELQSIGHEEGRIRVITPYINLADPANYLGGGIDLPGGKQGVFDYFINDHLGDVRSIVTEEINKASSVCTMENTDADITQKEEGLFGNQGINNEVASTRVDKQARASGWISNISSQVSMLYSTNGTAKVGPNVFLKVMAGDKISGRAQYYYVQDPGTSSGGTGLNAMLQSLALALTGGKATTVAHNEVTAIGNSLNSDVPLQSLYNSQSSSGSNTSAPKAYLSYIFFDEQFNYVGETSGFKRVSQAGDGADALQMTEVKAIKNGYVYIYLSNESAEPVYFDNFSVSHQRSPLIQEDHYYAFGLRIQAISSKAVTITLNPNLPNYGYQGVFSEEVTDFELNYNEFQLRNYDPQLGRWINSDPYCEFPSPYVGMGNDPVSNVDPTGGFIGPIFGFLKGLFSSGAGVIGCPSVSGAAASAGMSTVATVITTAGASFAIAGSIEYAKTASGIAGNFSSVGIGAGGPNGSVSGEGSSAIGESSDPVSQINGALNESIETQAGSLTLNDESSDPEQKNPYDFAWPDLARLVKFTDYHKKNNEVYIKHKKDPKSPEADDCTESALKGLEILTGEKTPSPDKYKKLVDALVKQGISDPISKTFEFLKQDGNTAKTADQVYSLKESLSNYIESRGSGLVNVYFISYANGYHLATILYFPTAKNDQKFWYFDQLKGATPFASGAGLDYYIAYWMKGNGGSTYNGQVGGEKLRAMLQINQLKHK